jgi:hypothetical protein
MRSTANGPILANPETVAQKPQQQRSQALVIPGRREAASPESSNPSL